MEAPPWMFDLLYYFEKILILVEYGLLRCWGPVTSPKMTAFWPPSCILLKDVRTHCLCASLLRT